MLYGLLEREESVVVVSGLVENNAFEVVCLRVIELYSEYLIEIIFGQLQLLHLQIAMRSFQSDIDIIRIFVEYL